MTPKRTSPASASRPAGAPISRALPLARFAAQHLLNEALTLRHLVEGLLVGADAPDFLVGERRTFIAGGALACVERLDLPFEEGSITRGTFVNRSIVGAEKARGTQSGHVLERRQQRLIGVRVDDEP